MLLLLPPVLPLLSPSPVPPDEPLTPLPGEALSRRTSSDTAPSQTGPVTGNTIEPQTLLPRAAPAVQQGAPQQQGAGGTAAAPTAPPAAQGGGTLRADRTAVPPRPHRPLTAGPQQLPPAAGRRDERRGLGSARSRRGKPASLGRSPAPPGPSSPPRAALPPGSGAGRHPHGSLAHACPSQRPAMITPPPQATRSHGSPSAAPPASPYRPTGGAVSAAAAVIAAGVVRSEATAGRGGRGLAPTNRGRAEERLHTRPPALHAPKSSAPPALKGPRALRAKRAGSCSPPASRRVAWPWLRCGACFACAGEPGWGGGGLGAAGSPSGRARMWCVGRRWPAALSRRNCPAISGQDAQTGRWRNVSKGNS